MDSNGGSVVNFATTLVSRQQWHSKTTADGLLPTGASAWFEAKLDGSAINLARRDPGLCGLQRK
jgi:hypothetical protein